MSEIAVVEAVPPPGAFEYRSAAETLEVRYPERIIEVLAVPYEREAIVEYRSRLIRETIGKGAFDGVQRRHDRIPVCRDHDLTRLVGRVRALSSRAEGLVAELKIGRGTVGDETLDFADDGLLDSSISFAPIPGHEHWSPDRMARRVDKAFLDHIALVPIPAYEDAKVLAVRSGQRQRDAAAAPATPNLDSIRIAALQARYGALDQVT